MEGMELLAVIPHSSIRPMPQRWCLFMVVEVALHQPQKMDLQVGLQRVGVWAFRKVEQRILMVVMVVPGHLLEMFIQAVLMLTEQGVVGLAVSQITAVHMLGLMVGDLPALRPLGELEVGQEISHQYQQLMVIMEVALEVDVVVRLE